MTRRKFRKLKREAVKPLIELKPKVSAYEANMHIPHEYCFDINAGIRSMQRRCMQSTKNLFKSLESDGYKTHYSSKFDHSYCYKSKGNRVLAVAHADSVQEARFFKRNGNIIFSPSLDDRLGVSIVTDILPMLGIECDVLITDEEESANSSAASFAAEHSYNWIVEFDRAWDDVVTYGYDGVEWERAIESHGFELGFGSYSDICEMYSMGICAMNIGIGYESYHSLSAWADLTKMDSNLRKFISFYNKHNDTKFEHKHSAKKYGRYSSFRDYDNYGLGYYGESFSTPKRHINSRMLCEGCGHVFWEDDAIAINAGMDIFCPSCGALLDVDECIEAYAYFADEFYREQDKKRDKLYGKQFGDIDVGGWDGFD